MRALRVMKALRLLSLLACALIALTGCGRSDAYSSMPEFMRYPKPAPPPPEPEPDAKALIRAGLATLFATKPSKAAISRVRHNPAGTGYTVCVKALVAGTMNSGQTPVTIVVSIEHGRLGDRRRAEPQDGCEAEDYEPV